MVVCQIRRANHGNVLAFLVRNHLRTLLAPFAFRPLQSHSRVGFGVGRRTFEIELLEDQWVKVYCNLFARFYSRCAVKCLLELRHFHFLALLLLEPEVVPVEVYYWYFSACTPIWNSCFYFCFIYQWYQWREICDCRRCR